MKRRRLKLAREVIAHLSAVQMADVHGGQTPCSDPTCVICDTVKPQPGCC